MSGMLRGSLTVLGRLLLCTIFFMAAVGNKIPHFSDVANVMGSVGVPAPQFMLAGAIVFLLVGSLSVIAGYQARLAKAVNALVADPERAERYGRAGRQRCIAEFSWAQIAQQTLEIYRKVCA